MVGSTLALSLLSLGVVQALPAVKPVEQRQGAWIGDGTGVFIPGEGEPPLCLTDTPLNEQPPCLLPPIVGGLNPSDKRDTVAAHKRRQIWIGDGSSVFVPGQGELPLCLTNKPLRNQPPCLLPPIVGGLKPSDKKREADESESIKKRQILIPGGSGVFVPGGGSLPECLTSVPISQQPPCFLPPISGGILTPTFPKEKRFSLPPDYLSNTKEVIKQLERELVALQNKKYKTAEDLKEIKAIKAALLYIAGITNIEAPPGTGTVFIPGKREMTKRFTLPPDYLSNTKEVLKRLERELVALQNKKNKTAEDLKEIKAIKAAILYIAGITNIEAPPGTGTVFIPGKREVTKRFTLPPDYLSNTKEVIKQLERELVALQNKKNKTAEDLKEIKAIKAAILYIAGITNIEAPPGSGTVFIPGKRDISLDTVGTYADQCPHLEGAELALETLLHKDKHTVEERIIMQKLAAFLKGCGITIDSSPDGTWTIIKPSDKKRDVATTTAQFDLTGLQKAYSALLAANPKPSFANWLALQQMASLLEIYGASVSLTVSTKRQSTDPTLTIGTKACQLADVMGLRAALAALLTAYGSPANAPPSIFLVEQVLVTALQICGQSVAGWTTLIPGNPLPGGPIIPNPTIPGGPIIPDPTTPGSPIVPDPTTPGGEIKPSDKKARQAPVGDPAALFAALQVLEAAYGGYGSGTIPVPVWLIMVNVVTILQTFPGVVVPGWPVLGQGSVVIGPSP